jgi:hypothetical protein
MTPLSECILRLVAVQAVCLYGVDNAEAKLLEAAEQFKRNADMAIEVVNFIRSGR